MAHPVVGAGEVELHHVKDEAIRLSRGTQTPKPFGNNFPAYSVSWNRRNAIALWHNYYSLLGLSYGTPLTLGRDESGHNSSHGNLCFLLQKAVTVHSSAPRRTGLVKMSIDDLRFFQVVAASETLTAASRQLGWSLPAVSKRLSTLESRLHVRLVQRSTRQLVLTSEGALYAGGLDSILDQLHALEDQVTDHSAALRGALVVQATPGLGRAHVAPLLAEFAASHPQLHLQLQTSALPLRPHRTNFDVAVHVGNPPDSSLRMRRLARNRRVPCAAPSYLDRCGAPTDLEDLAQHDCIVLRENEGDYALWRFGDAGDPRHVRVRGLLSSNDGDIVTGWALEGHGVIMRSEWHVRPLIERGELVRVLPHITTPAADIYALFEDDGHVPRRVAKLIDHLAVRLPGRLEGSA
ncbi:LysR family transcriptional regulator [Streptomyces fagopyri]|nr:LysR family transcriptional regulator [Streptomyces fagopyri]